MKRPSGFNPIGWGIDHRKMVFVVFVALIALGIVGLFRMNRDEFPTFRIKMGLVAAVYPGATAREMEEQVATPLEEILFSFQEVNRSTTTSVSKDGICYIYVDLGDNVPQAKKDEIWSKIKLKLNQAKAQLPPGVLGVAAVDDFAQVSAMILALTSTDKGTPELTEYAETLASRLRTIPQLASVSLLGKPEEEIAVTLDAARLSLYGLSSTQMLLDFQTAGFLTTAGAISSQAVNAPLKISDNVSSESQVADHIVYCDPEGNVVRLRDIARIERRIRRTDASLSYNGTDAVLLNIEMRPDNNIADFGLAVNRVIAEYRDELPQSVHIETITDQPEVVNHSILVFLRDLLISMLVVILVMLMLFPLRSALIASSGVPVCTALAVGLMFVTGIDLNTVTLAALIVVLGMIVDDSIITMDGYMAHIRPGVEPRQAATESGRELVMPMLMATAAIGLMFFPAAHILTGYFGDFVGPFPWIVAFALGFSFLYAVFVVPSLEVRFLRPGGRVPRWQAAMERVQNRFFAALQRAYDRAEEVCFRHPKVTLSVGLVAVALAVIMFLNLNVQMMPRAARKFFAVEIYLEAGSSADRTRAVADSLERMLMADKRVTKVTSFVGQPAPRFNALNAPLLPAPNVAQMIVCTRSEFATASILKDYQTHHAHLFPGARVKYKQMDYQASSTPLEVYIDGGTYDQMQPVADSIKACMLRMSDLTQCVSSSADGVVTSIGVELDPEQAGRYGINRSQLSLYLAGATAGSRVTTMYEGSTAVLVVLYDENYDSLADYETLRRQLIPTSYPGVNVQLGSVARLEPVVDHEQYCHHAGRPAITVGADIRVERSQAEAQRKLDKYIETLDLPEGVEVHDSGLASINSHVIPEIAGCFAAAVLVMLVFLLLHFRRVSLSLLTMTLSLLCLFGAFFGLWVLGLDFSVTAALGLITLVGIIVRNGIIMFDYAEELRLKEGYDLRTAALLAGRRRMRPIFLTSCTTALGVLPMIISGDLLWMPMGVTIAFGTMLSILLIVLIMPISYWQLFKLKYK